MGYDLHIHSIFSDGTIKPADLIRRAVDKKLDGIALTDHDTIAGIPEAINAAEKMDFLFIPGVEITTDYGETEVHILGYNFDLNSEKLNHKFRVILESRNDRARQILKKLQNHKIQLSWEQIKSKTTSSFIGRTHIFKALESAGQISPVRRREAFEYYLGKNGLAYVPHCEISTLEAIEIITAAGGIAVLAHPGRMADDALIQTLVDAGLRGIEVFYPSHTQEQTRFYNGLAKQYHLVVTGGSDYHGAFSQTKMGDAQVDTIADWYTPKLTLAQFP